MDTAIAHFGALLAEPLPDIAPSGFDARESLGTPMGRYLFRREQPRRNSIPNSYANDGGKDDDWMEAITDIYWTKPAAPKEFPEGGPGSPQGETRAANAYVNYIIKQ